MGWYEDWKKFTSQDWSPTKLSAAEEKRFREEMAKSAWLREIQADIAYEKGGEIIPEDKLLDDMLGPSADYDLRGAWKAGVKPVRDPSDNNRLHWPDADPGGRMLKSPRHPSAWMEFFMREHKQDPGALGIRTPEEAMQWQVGSQP